MKNRIVISCLTALVLSAVTAMACNYSIVLGTVSCPNGTTASGIRVYIPGGPETLTDDGGLYVIEDLYAGKYTICVDPTTLPPGLSIQGNPCAKFSVDGYSTAEVDFTLNGPACRQTPPGGCWLTGGGTIGSGKVPDYNFGGVVNPGCSPIAAGGGNWNVIDRLQNVHFKGLYIGVIECSGVQDKAPKVNVNIIDFKGVGILEGIEGNSMMPVAVNFTARAIDNGEPGGGKDALYLSVYTGDTPTLATTLLLISTSSDPAVVAPVSISTGNLQIHTTSCFTPPLATN
jgi:hypothetical protein